MIEEANIRGPLGPLLTWSDLTSQNWVPSQRNCPYVHVSKNEFLEVTFYNLHRIWHRDINTITFSRLPYFLHLGGQLVAGESKDLMLRVMLKW